MGKKRNRKMGSSLWERDTYFDGNEEFKKAVIEVIIKVYNYGKKRNLVPKVNSGAEDLNRILRDLFVQTI